MKHFTPKLLCATVPLCLLLTGCMTSNLQGMREKSIVVLYENDVHCAIDGYAKIAGIRQLIADTAWTSIVSSGDYLQGGTAGAISKGQYIMDVMKHVGYDAVTLGNHEFDYKIPRMFELLNQLKAPVTCVNVIDTRTGKKVFAPYILKKIGKKKIAYIGAVTPTTMESESYSFYDESGKLIYDLVPDQTYNLVQQAADEVRRKGADYVFVLSHLGEDPNHMNVDSHGLARNTTGINVILDGHSHNTIPSVTINNKEGKPVIITQTGTQFANLGKMVIMPNGTITTSLIPVNEMPYRSITVQHAIDEVKKQMNEVTGRQVCHSEVDLRILDENGRQQVRKAETNAGDIVADAFRIMTGADLAMTNGGGIRSEVNKGDLTYGDIVSLLPYDNYLCMVEVTGAKILELLKENTSLLPLEDGQFPQVSGIKFTVDVKTHSIKDAQVMNKETGAYEPLVPEKTYTLSTTDYCISGGGFKNILKDAKVVKDGMMLYNDALVEFVTKKLNGRITTDYAKPQGRITIQ